MALRVRVILINVWTATRPTCIANSIPVCSHKSKKYTPSLFHMCVHKTMQQRLTVVSPSTTCILPAGGERLPNDQRLNSLKRFMFLSSFLALTSRASANLPIIHNGASKFDCFWSSSLVNLKLERNEVKRSMSSIHLTIDLPLCPLICLWRSSTSTSCHLVAVA